MVVGFFVLFCFLKPSIGYSAEINASFILIAILGGVCICVKKAKSRALTLSVWCSVFLSG